MLNPGSVDVGYDQEQNPESIRFDPWAAWAVVSTGGGRLSIDLRKTPFDVQAVADAHRSSGMPYRGEYATAWARG